MGIFTFAMGKRIKNLSFVIFRFYLLTLAAILGIITVWIVGYNVKLRKIFN
jgi:hypothetical protein